MCEIMLEIFGILERRLLIFFKEFKIIFLKSGMEESLWNLMKGMVEKMY